NEKTGNPTVIEKTERGAGRFRSGPQATFTSSRTQDRRFRSPFYCNIFTMDASLLASATTTAAAHTIAVATSTTVATTIGRSGQRNGTHRGAVNVHGRLMYDEIVINDVWINAILSTLALSCAACVCLCFLYCKIQQWKIGGKT
ncbi:Uncharacterized protein FWK35_00037726, partial [Aphis craccivora]